MHFQCLKGSHGRNIANQEQKIVEGSRKDLAVNVFFKNNDLRCGNKIPIYFPIKDPSNKPPLLSREESNSIPFSSSKLEFLLDFFQFSKESQQAKAMEETLKHCEFKSIKGETKFCSTSLESMMDSVVDIFGISSEFDVLTTTHLTKSSLLLQNYTILDEPKVILGEKIVACHTLPYPYAVYYCHSQKSDNKVYKVSLMGENGGGKEELIDAAAICHMDTSKWDPNHVAFQVLKTEPGKSPVCHFFPEDNLVWIETSSSS